MKGGGVCGASYCQQQVFRVAKDSNRGVGGVWRGVQETCGQRASYCQQQVFRVVKGSKRGAGGTQDAQAVLYAVTHDNNTFKFTA